MSAHVEVKCPKCGKQFNSEEEMLKHFDEQHGNETEEKSVRKKSRKPRLSSSKTLAAVLTVVLVFSLAAGIFTLSHISGNSYPAQAYAADKEIPSSINVAGLNDTWGLDSGAREKAILDYASTLNGTYQDTFLSALLPVKNTDAEYQQVQFLQSLPLDQQLQLIGNGDSANFDINNDGMSNYFEHNIAGLPWADQPTGRYALIVVTDNRVEATSSNEGDQTCNFLINREHFNPNNVIELVGVNATRQNVELQLNSLSKRITRSDILALVISAHGTSGMFACNDGNGNNQNVSLADCMGYTDLNSYLNQINAKYMLISIMACSSETAINPLKDGTSPRVVITAQPSYITCDTDDWSRDNSLGFAPPDPKMFDINGDGFVSISEEISTIQKFQLNGPFAYSDDSKIASNFYLGDFDVNTVQPWPYYSYLWSLNTKESPTVNVILFAGKTTQIINGSYLFGYPDVEMTDSNFGFGLNRNILTSPGPQLTFKVGDVVEVTLYNVDRSFSHSWEISTEPNGNGNLLFNSAINYPDIVYPNTPILPCGASSVVFKVTTPGDFYYISPVPGDVQGGLWGKVIVTP